MTERKYAANFGFSTGRGGAHSSRTIMLDELSALLATVGDISANKETYLQAIDIENCLGKRSGKTRILTFKHLVELYALDAACTLFRALRYFWQRDQAGQPLSALLCAYARDPLLSMATPFILAFPLGTTVGRETVESCIEAANPERFSKATLKSTAQNINASLTKSGHLMGKARKIRTISNPTAGNMAYALLLGYLSGVRGENLFKTEYVKLLDCPVERAMELAEEASRKGWITFKRVGNVMEVLFPNLLTPQEMEWIREQN